jgi:hypothetical protein
MYTETFIEQETQTNTKLHLFSLYVDFAASVRARWATGTITRMVGPRWKTSSEMWNLDCFTASHQLRKIMLQDAADADVLIIALSSLDQRQPRLIEWLSALAENKTEHRVSGLFIGLLGDEDHEAGELEWTVKQFMGCAQKMGRDFIWHWMGQEAINDTTWLVDDVGKTLSRKRSSPNTVMLQETLPPVGQRPDAVWLAADHFPTTHSARSEF